MKLLFKVVVGLFCMVAAAQAEMVAPDVLIKNTAQDVIEIIKKDKDIQAGNQKKILELVDAKVLPHFDFQEMTKRAVGKSWLKATPEQKQALVTGFRNTLVRTYTTAFTVYRDQKVEVKPFKMAADATDVKVQTSIIKQGAQPVAVDYKMVKTADGWKVYDLSIDGVGMVASYRGTFATQIREGGIDGLIKTLEAKSSAAATVPLRKDTK